MLEKEISMSNASSLKQLSLQFDSQIKNANTFFHRIDLDPDITKFILQDSRAEIDVSAIYKTHKILKTMLSANASDLLIYFTNSDRIVSSVNTSLNMEKYYNVYYASKKFNYGSFRSCFNDTNISSVKSFGDIYDIAIFHSLPFNNRKSPNAIAMYKLNRTAVIEMLNSARYCDDAIIAIINREGDIIATTDSDYDLSILSQIDETSSYYKQTVDGMEYIFQTVNSDYSGCSFVSIVPTSIFWAKLYTIRTYSIFVTLLYILLGIIISFLLSRHNYAPISSLIEDINQKNKVMPASDTYGSRSEIDYIRSIIDTTLSEQEQYTKVRQDEFLLQAIQGIYPKDKDIFDAFEAVGLQLLSDRFVIMLFYIDSWDCTAVPPEYQYNQILLLEPIIKNGLNGLCSGRHQVFVTYNTLDTCIGILNLSDQYSENASEICHSLQNSLKNEMKITCTMAFSAEHSGWDGLEAALKEAEAALKYRTIFGTGSILSYRELEDGSRFRYNFDSHGSAKHLIHLSIINGEPSPYEVVEQIKEDSCSGGIHSLEEYRCYFYDMNNLLHKVTDKIGLGKDLLDRLAYCETLQQLDAQVVEILSQLRKLYLTQVVQREDYEREKELCSEIMAFIEQNYSDPNLSVGNIGEHFDLTSAYLSRRFKEFTGITIFEFLTNTRIERAKELLTYTDNTLEEISEEVGFNSSATLIRVFKKVEDVTPGAYRQIYRESICE